MKTTFSRSIISLVFTACFLAVCALPASGADAGSDKPKDPFKEKFEIVLVKSVFNPDRGYRPPPPAPRKTPPAPPSPDKIALTGVIVSEKNSYAFFDGSDSKYRKAAKLNDELGEFKVTEITSNHATLKAGEEKFKIEVGHEMEKRGEDPWKVMGTTSFSSGSSMSRSSTTSSSSSSAPSTSSATSSGGGEKKGMPDALRRLLEKRKKEQGK